MNIWLLNQQMKFLVKKSVANLSMLELLPVKCGVGQSLFQYLCKLRPNLDVGNLNAFISMVPLDEYLLSIDQVDVLFCLLYIVYLTELYMHVHVTCLGWGWVWS